MGVALPARLPAGALTRTRTRTRTLTVTLALARSPIRTRTRTFPLIHTRHLAALRSHARP